MYSRQIGRITRKRFVFTEETVLEILKERLRSEEDVSVRERIRQKMELFC